MYELHNIKTKQIICTSHSFKNILVVMNRLIKKTGLEESFNIYKAIKA